MVFENRQEAGKKLGGELLKYRQENPYVLAMPVCALDTVEGLKKLVDEVICLATPFDFMAVGVWYKNFAHVSDEEVVDLLRLNRSLLKKSKQPSKEESK